MRPDALTVPTNWKSFLPINTVGLNADVDADADRNRVAEESDHSYTPVNWFQTSVSPAVRSFL